MLYRLEIELSDIVRESPLRVSIEAETRVLRMISGVFEVGLEISSTPRNEYALLWNAETRDDLRRCLCRRRSCTDLAMNLEMIVEELLPGQACFAPNGHDLFEVVHSFCLGKNLLRALKA